MKVSSLNLDRDYSREFAKFPISSLGMIIIVSSFGPYIVPELSLRLEQVVIYVTFALLFLTGKIVIPRSTPLLWMLVCLYILLLVPIFTLHQENYIRLSLAAAQIENYFQAPVVFLIFLTIFQRLTFFDQQRLFSQLTIALLCMLALNTIFSLYINWNPETQLLQIFTGSRQISEYGLSITGLTSAEANVGGGRISGVFGQIVEAGFAYALGLFLWEFNYRKNQIEGFVAYSLLILILIGGFLTFSKVFLVLGVSLFLMTLGLKRLLRLSLVVLLFSLVVILANPSIVDSINELKGLAFVFRLIDFNSLDFFNVYTSNRFSSESIIISNILHTLNHSPLFGFGYGSIETSDFSLNEIVSLGGLFGLTAYLFLHFLIASFIFKIKQDTSRTLFIKFVILVTLSALSAPIITANRISVFIWLILAWACCTIRGKNRRSLENSQT